MSTTSTLDTLDQWETFGYDLAAYFPDFTSDQLDLLMYCILTPSTGEVLLSILHNIEHDPSIPSDNMPALPGSSFGARKGTTSIAKPDKEQIWERMLEIAGVEALNERDRPIPTIPAIEATLTLRDGARYSLPALPIELQRKIFGFSSTSDLLTLALVSKELRDVACEHLYRKFQILFPDDDGFSIETEPLPVDALARGLDTLTNSNYDYAKFLREISIEPQTVGSKGESSYRSFITQDTSTKLLNTLLRLTLKKATSLETYKWDVRVELGGDVFNALHQIQSLQHVHLRMHAGQSSYLPLSVLNSHLLSVNPPPPPGSASQPTSMSNSPLVGGSSKGVNFYLSMLKAKDTQKAQKTQALVSANTTPTLSGFKNLKTLAVLDMDTYEYITELSTCLQNSSSTLTSLKMSFSEDLALKSRKPPPDVPSDDDTDQDDEFGQPISLVPPPPVGVFDPSGPSKLHKAKEEEKKQAAVLGKIFGIETKPPKVKSDKSPATPPAVKSDGDPKEQFVKNLVPIAAKLMSHAKPSTNVSEESKMILELITKASAAYLTDLTVQANSDCEAMELAHSQLAQIAAADENQEDEGPGLFDRPEEKKKGQETDPGVSNPEDINIEEPEGDDRGGEHDAVSESVSDPIATEAPLQDSEVRSYLQKHQNDQEVAIFLANSRHLLQHTVEIHSALAKIMQEREVLKARIVAMKTLKDSPEFLAQGYAAVVKAHEEGLQLVHEFTELTYKMQDLIYEMHCLDGEREQTQMGDKSNAATEMQKYVRNTRGLTLETLSIFLIPVRASVLSRAIDISCLRNITLLNVGPQSPFWTMVAGENKLKPLPLRKIHTDNVSLPFLTCVYQLTKLEELYMLERGNSSGKRRVETTALKTNVTIEQIRKVILKKHAPSLKVLMIRNDASVDWDLNVKSIMLLCQRATKLEELAASFGSRPLHTLLQFFPGLVSLRALHTVQFRSNDTCLWATQEVRKFFVDNISHHPELKLEWLALDSTIERVVRRKFPAKPKTDNTNAKDNAGSVPYVADLLLGHSDFAWPESMSGGSGSSALPMSNIISGLNTMDNSYGPDGDSSDEESDGNAKYAKTGLKIEVVEGIRFTDIVGVSIFTNEILSGRL